MTESIEGEPSVEGMEESARAVYQDYLQKQKIDIADKAAEIDEDRGELTLEKYAQGRAGKGEDTLALVVLELGKSRGEITEQGSWGILSEAFIGRAKDLENTAKNQAVKAQNLGGEEAKKTLETARAYKARAISFRGKAEILKKGAETSK